MIRTLQQYGPPGGRVTWNNPTSLAEYGPPGGLVTWTNPARLPASLGAYSDQGYPIPYFYPGAGSRGRTTLGDVTPAAIAPTVSDPSGLSTFGVGILESPWFYVGLGLLGVYLYLGPTGRAKQRRKKRNQIPPLTAALYAAGAGAGGYMLGKYSGL